MKCVGILLCFTTNCIISAYDNYGNIAQVPQMKKWKDADIDQRIDELMDMVGLEPEV